MHTAFPLFSWEDALREFLLDKEAHFAAKTHTYYRVQLTQLSRWAQAQGVALDAFTKRHLDRYLIERHKEGKKPLTLHHDAICAKAFFSWCARNKVIKKSLLAEYKVRRAPKPPRYMPTDEDVSALMRAVRAYWDVSTNPAARFQDVAKRSFHRDRNYAILLGLVDTACRIGEMLSFKVDDVRLAERQVTVRESKGREPRTLPISEEWAEALRTWLKVRARVMARADEDEGWLFVTEFGEQMDPLAFLRCLERMRSFAGLPRAITLHSLRRYSLNKLAKHNLLAAQRIAGHKDTKTTIGYTELDADHLRQAHDEVGVVKAILGTRAQSRKKRLI
jgi:site-specific recombinase XerD